MIMVIIRIRAIMTMIMTIRVIATIGKAVERREELYD